MLDWGLVLHLVRNYGYAVVNVRLKNTVEGFEIEMIIPQRITRSYNSFIHLYYSCDGYSRMIKMNSCL